MKYYQGKYKPTNPSKYRGDVSNIIYRSSWELTAMRYFDTNPNVLAWGSEEFAIPYYSPVDKRIHRYFPDFIIQVRDKDGSLNNIVVEIKPMAQTSPPRIRDRKNRRYINEVFTYVINEAKWKAAEAFCAERKMQFRVITEKELFGR